MQSYKLGAEDEFSLHAHKSEVKLLWCFHIRSRIARADI